METPTITEAMITSPAEKHFDELFLKQSELLAGLTQGEGVHVVLKRLVLALEEHLGAWVSIMVVEEQEGVRVLRPLVAPSLPPEYVAAIGAVPVADGVGSCGTAAATGRRVATVDIATDPRWDIARDVALQAGLRACWSTPITGTENGRILGSFACYHPTPHEPTEAQWKLLERFAHIAALGLEREYVVQDLKAREALMLSVLNALPSHTAIVDASGVITHVNVAWDEFATSNGDDPRGMSVGCSYLEVCDAAAKSGEDGWLDAARTGVGLRGVLDGWLEQFTHDYACTSPSDKRWFSLTIVPLGDEGGAVISHYDITDREAASQRLAEQALYDPLTGLPNRMQLLQHLERVMDAGQGVAVLVADLDGFKQVNDSFGHSTGDLVLCNVAERLRDELPPNVMVSRFGGDEFTLVCPVGDDGHNPLQLAERLSYVVAKPTCVDGLELFLSASIGIAQTSESDRDAHVLLQEADTAMYRAKERGRDRVEIFTDQLREAARERLAVASALRNASSRDELLVWYQPVVDLATRQPIGAEALVRWQHPDRGLLPPAAFVGVAEDSGLIAEMDGFVRATAIARLSSWLRWDPEFQLSVNVSARQFSDPALRRSIEAALSRHSIPPDHLVVEITESTLMHDLESAVGILESLRELGVGVAIDDFGTGFSSLNYLKRLPVDILKIDRSFIAGFGVDPSDDAIVRAIIGLARTLGLRVVAEGVETEEQRSSLIAAGCRYGQGYLFAPPLLADELTAQMARRRSSQRLRAG